MKGAEETAVVTTGAKLEAERVEEVKAVVAMAWKLGVPGRGASGQRVRPQGARWRRARARARTRVSVGVGVRVSVSVSVRVRVGLGSRTHLEVVDSS